jgi:hypothetical protein
MQITIDPSAIAGVELRPATGVQAQESDTPPVTQEHSLAPQGGQSANTSKTGGAK